MHQPFNTEKEAGEVGEVGEKVGESMPPKRWSGDGVMFREPGGVSLEH